MASKVNYSVYIYKVLKQVHPDTGISSGALRTTNEIVKSTIMDIGKVANGLALVYNKKTVTGREIQAAVKIVLPGELAKHADSEGSKAIAKFNASVSGSTKSPKKSGAKSKSTSNAARAGLTFSPSRVRKLLGAQVSVGRIGVGAPIYLAAVVEYLTAEIFELSGNTSRDHKRVRVNNRDIMLSVSHDDEFAQLYTPKKYILGGGVVAKEKEVKNAL
jgi:histone H2B